MTLRLPYLVMVELSLLITVPLKTETGGVMLGIDETYNPVYIRVRPLTPRTAETDGWISLDFLAAVQTS
jgi:hypothetical protein